MDRPEERRSFGTILKTGARPLVVCATFFGCGRGEPPPIRVDAGPVTSAPTSTKSARPEPRRAASAPLPAPAASRRPPAKDSAFCNDFRRCLRGKLPTTYDRAGQEVEAGVRACLGERDALEIGNCLPYGFGKTKSGLGVEVDVECFARRGVSACLEWRASVGYERYLSSEECVCYEGTPGSGRAMGTYGGCFPPPGPSAVIVPRDELRKTDDPKASFVVESAEPGNRLWYLGLSRGARVTGVNGARASERNVHLLRGPLVVLSRVELDHGSHRIAYVDRSVLASFKKRLHAITKDRAPDERCQKDFVTMYFGSEPTREDRWYFDRSCQSEIIRRFNDIAGEVERTATRPNRRALRPLACDELAENPPVLRVARNDLTVELRDIDWWKLGSILR